MSSGFNFPQRLLKHVKLNAKQGDIDNVLFVIDQYCRTVEPSMNIGSPKVKILESVVKERNPKTILELGTYCGYSGLCIANWVGDDVILHTVEVDPENAAVACEIIKFAGMEHKIKILIGSSSDVIPTISKDLGITSFDFIFIDHWKDLYKPDLMLLEEHRLLKNGSVIVADNVIYPGAPDYLEYVRNNPKFECTNFPCKLDYIVGNDAMEKCVYKG